MVSPSAAAAGGRLGIDLAALRANYRRFAALAGGAECAAVVKANAYGIGVGRVVPELLAAGCRTFFVAQLVEAREVAALLSPGATLYVLSGFHPGAEAAFLELGVVPVLNSHAQLERWRQLAEERGERLPAALQIDTGMSRLGMSFEEAQAIASDEAFARAIDCQLVMSHLSCGDDSEAPANWRQLEIFRAAAALFPGVPHSLANSGGTVLGEPFACDLARVGIALYGGNPTDDPNVAPQPVVSLDAKVVQLRTVPPGTGVGYGLTFVTRRETRIATLGIGYADGWPRSLSGRGAAYFGGVRLPILGRVSMDSMTIDVTDLPTGTIDEGDWIELIGPHQSVDDVASAAGTISYEILTNLKNRFQVRLLDRT